MTPLMSFYDTSCQIATLLEGHNAIYLRTEPEVPDFTVKASFKAIVSNKRQRVEIEVTPENVISVISLFDATIFNKEIVTHLYVWNLKALSSYFYFCVAKFVTPTTNVIDLKIIESFLGLRKNRPENLVEAINRTKILVKYKAWQRLYKAVHLPLSLRVLPSIETTPLLNDQTRRSEYPYYDIEGQANGRLNCLKKFARSYLPHNMGPDVKSVLKPKGYGMRFLGADYRFCEVVVLQWLSKDEKLKEIIDSGDDVHRAIYELIAQDPCNTETKRAISKKMFLPVMYGCGPKGLAHNLKQSDKVGKELFRRIGSQFTTAMKWMWQRQQEAKRGIVVDYFGRPRKFDANESYQARNAAVQGVAATVCQEKLIDLHKALDGEDVRLAFSVHDGYGVICKMEAARHAYQTVKRVLETESVLCPGLEMKVEIKFGARLNAMKVLWRD